MNYRKRTDSHQLIIFHNEQRIVDYNLRNTCNYEPNLSRTIHFSKSYFPNILGEWNTLDKAVQGSPSICPECFCGAAIEDTEHYLLHCPQFCTLSLTILGQISDAGFDIANMSTNDLCCLLLYGRPNGGAYINRMILEATISFIKSSN